MLWSACIRSIDSMNRDLARRAHLIDLMQDSNSLSLSFVACDFNNYFGYFATGRNVIGIEINETRIVHCKRRLNVTNLAKLGQHDPDYEQYEIMFCLWI